MRRGVSSGARAGPRRVAAFLLEVHSVNIELDRSQAALVLQSLEYTKSAFENTTYPSYEMKRERVGEVQEIIDVIRKERKREKHERANSN